MVPFHFLYRTSLILLLSLGNMQTKLTFLGGAGNVTGSRYLIEANNLRVLVDCGMHQERDLRGRDWAPFPVPPETINAVLLTHAHLDHCGFLPKLVRDGFRGPIYCTPATTEIARIVLLDSAKLQEEDAEFKKKRHEREGREGPYPEIPLYTIADAEAVSPLFSPVPYEQVVKLDGGFTATFHDAGHVLGSAMIRVGVRLGRGQRSIIFSGDIGGWDKPILNDPTFFKAADYILVESTYGDRLSEPIEASVDKFAEAINETAKAGGNIVIPSFALERSQVLLYYLNKLLLENQIPHLAVFVDSPMAVGITEVFQHHPELFDEEMRKLIRQKKSPFHFAGLNLVTTVDESKAINHIQGTVIIIAGSGLCTGGRIKHHLVTNISRRERTIVFVGYQAIGTLGRLILDGAKSVRILGQQHKVRAKVIQLGGFSAHADRDELLQWLSGFKKTPRCVFVTHGEPETLPYFAGLVRDRFGGKVLVPGYLSEVVLD